MYAVAISNNDMVYLYWNVDHKIPDCLGFNIVRHDAKSGEAKPLPAMVRFPKDNKDKPKFSTTDKWPIQKYGWKDLFAPRGGTYWYEVIPMIGAPGKLRPDLAHVMRTPTVTVDSNHGDCAVYFNRGIISTQAIAHDLPKSKDGRPLTKVLEERIQEVGNPTRERLVGDLNEGVLSLLKRAEDDGGTCCCALYELSDKELVGGLLELKSKVQIILSNAGEDTEEGSGDGDSTNQEARAEIHAADIRMADRMLKKGHIGHNKFVVYKEGRVAKAVLSGSTNWTPTGLCAQSNNAIVINSAGLAGDYLKYWESLRQDTAAANGDGTALQGAKFRTGNESEREAHELNGKDGKPGGNVRAWFSPNTKQKSVPRKTKDGKAVPPPTPPDLEEVFGLIENARQGALFLAFIPGNPSIVSKLKEVYDAKRKEGKLFYLRGAATSPDPAGIFRVDLYHRSSKSDASVRGVDSGPGSKSSAKVASVAGIYAAFAQWETEIYKIGHAVIHDKILVIDPFTKDCVVVTGSHNLGYKASYANDENMLIIRNNREVAEAYAAHVLDVYEHYRWRWRLQQPLRDALEKEKAKHPDAKTAELWKKVMSTVGLAKIKEAFSSLSETDTWQDFYQENKDFLAAEVNFWSPFGGEAAAHGEPVDPATRPRRNRRPPR